MEDYHIYALLSALVYAISAVFSKTALMLGCGILRLSFVMNLVFAAVFISALGWQVESFDVSAIHQPLLTGTCFFIAHVFTFAAIRTGDVSLQTPLMGTKAVFVALLAVLFGLQAVTWELVLAALLAAAAVGLLGFSGGGVQKVGRTIALSLCSASFSPVRISWWGCMGPILGRTPFSSSRC